MMCKTLEVKNNSNGCYTFRKQLHKQAVIEQQFITYFIKIKVY